MALEVIDALAKIVGIIIAVPGAYLSYKRWFKPASIGLALDSVLFLGPGAQEDIDNRCIWVTAQLRFYNAGAMPESITEISAFELTVTQDSESCSFTAYSLLKPLKMSSRKQGEPSQFFLEFEELAHSLVVKSQEQVVIHLLFIPDRGLFVPRAGRITLRFDIKAKLSDGKVMEFPPMVRYRQIQFEEAKELRKEKAKIAWMSWHLEDINQNKKEKEL